MNELTFFFVLKTAQRKIFIQIEILMHFYNVEIYVIDVDDNDDFVENKFTKKNVDKCMKNLLNHWKIEWKQILEIEKQHLTLSQQIEKKRSKNANDEKIQKKMKKNEHEKSNN